MPTEADLEELACAAERKWIPVVRFREPDRGNELTAIALGPQGKNLVRRLALTLGPEQP